MHIQYSIIAACIGIRRSSPAYIAIKIIGKHTRLHNPVDCSRPVLVGGIINALFPAGSKRQALCRTVTAALTVYYSLKFERGAVIGIECNLA